MTQCEHREKPGLRCPHCGVCGQLKVEWTVVKGDSLRRYAFRCRTCDEPVTGWLTIDVPARN